VVQTTVFGAFRNIYTINFYVFFVRAKQVLPVLMFFSFVAPKEKNQKKMRLRLPRFAEKFSGKTVGRKTRFAQTARPPDRFPQKFLFPAKQGGRAFGRFRFAWGFPPFATFIWITFLFFASFLLSEPLIKLMTLIAQIVV
jgi:hypothetical protein